MFIEIVESLRCIEPHEDSWLIGAFDVVEGRDVLTGVLGCPVCEAEYPIRDGAVWFTPERRRTGLVDPVSSEAEGTRVAAFLGLTDARGFAILAGVWGAHAQIVSALSPTPLVLFNPPRSVASAPGITIVHSDQRVPFAARSARGLAIDAATADAIAGLVAAVRPGGRLIGPSDLPIPEGVDEIARDATTWIAERRIDEVLIPLARR